MKNIKEKYEKICSAYVHVFVKKHGYEFTDWVADDVGGIACFIEQYYFSLDDIRYDINNDLPKNLIFEWQEYLIDNHFKNQELGIEDVVINLRSYWKGLRV